MIQIMAMFTYGHSFIAPRHIKIYSKPMITSHKCISAYINKDTLYAFQEKSEFITKMKKEKKKQGGVRCSPVRIKPLTP